MEGGPKRRRLAPFENLLHRGGVSIAGLTEILSELGHDTVARSSLQNLNLDRFMELRKVIRAQCGGDTFVDLEMLDVTKALPAYLANSLGMQRLHADAATRSPPTLERPWSLVAAYDEFAPGNKLQASGQTRQHVAVLDLHRCLARVVGTTRQLGPTCAQRCVELWQLGRQSQKVHGIFCVFCGTGASCDVQR